MTKDRNTGITKDSTVAILGKGHSFGVFCCLNSYLFFSSSLAISCLPWCDLGEKNQGLTASTIPWTSRRIQRKPTCLTSIALKTPGFVGCWPYWSRSFWLFIYKPKYSKIDTHLIFIEFLEIHNMSLYSATDFSPLRADNSGLFGKIACFIRSV